MKISYWSDWAEIVGFILLVIGFFVSLLAGSAVIAYILVLLAGGIGGRIWFRIKQDLKTPWVIILLGLLIGFVLGSRYGNNFVIILFYLVSIGVSYYIHEKGIIKSAEY